MTLWNIIRDWFVINIWGGLDSNGGVYLNNVFGHFMVDNPNGGYYFMDTNTATSWFKVGSHYINFGDWASTTSTIIVLIALCFFFFLMVRWLFRLTAGLIHGRG